METTQKEIWVLAERDFHIDHLKEKYPVNQMGYGDTMAGFLMKKKDKPALIIIQNEIPSYGFFDAKFETKASKAFKNEKADRASLNGFFAYYFYKEVIKPLNIPTLFWYWRPEWIKMAKDAQVEDSNIHFIESFEVDDLLNAVKEIIGE